MKAILGFHSVRAQALNGKLQFTDNNNSRGEGHLVRAKANAVEAVTVYDTRFLLGKNKAVILPYYFCRQKKSGDKINRDHLVPQHLVHAWLVANRGNNDFGSLDPDVMAKNVNYGYVRSTIKRAALILQASGDVRNPEAVRFLRQQKLGHLALVNKAARKNFESRLISKGKATHIARRIVSQESAKAQTTISTIKTLLNNTELTKALKAWKNEQEQPGKSRKAKVLRDHQQKEFYATVSKPEGFNTVKGLEVHTLGADPVDADSDDDGLTDGQEVDETLTDPNNADSDDDGLININTANQSELETLPGIGPSKAAAIIDYRAQKAFTDIKQLDNVRGISSRLRDTLQDLICV